MPNIFHTLNIFADTCEHLNSNDGRYAEINNPMENGAKRNVVGHSDINPMEGHQVFQKPRLSSLRALSGIPCSSVFYQANLKGIIKEQKLFSHKPDHSRCNVITIFTRFQKQ